MDVTEEEASPSNSPGSAGIAPQTPDTSARDTSEAAATSAAAAAPSTEAAASASSSPEAAPNAYAAQLQSILEAQAASDPEDLYSYRPPETNEAGQPAEGGPKDFRSELRDRAVARAAARAQAAQVRKYLGRWYHCRCFWEKVG